MAELLGPVVALRRFPVKSMHGEHLDAAVMGTAGLLGDRALGVVETATGQVLRAKTPDVGPLLLACRARFVKEPAPGEPLPPVEVELPDGTLLRTDEDDADERLSRHLGRDVRLQETAPAAAAFVAGRRDVLDDWGLPQLDPQSFLDAMPVSVLTTSALDALGQARPTSRFDERRFRMNVVVSTTQPGFLENDWTGRALQVAGVRLRVAVPTPRCVFTTMAQDDLPRDPAVLRTATMANSLALNGKNYPCVGAYATVDVAGELRLGDPVVLDPSEEA